MVQRAVWHCMVTIYSTADIQKPNSLFLNGTRRMERILSQKKLLDKLQAKV